MVRWMKCLCPHVCGSRVIMCQHLCGLDGSKLQVLISHPNVHWHILDDAGSGFV